MQRVWERPALPPEGEPRDENPAVPIKMQGDSAAEAASAHKDARSGGRSRKSGGGCSGGGGGNGGDSAACARCDSGGGGPRTGRSGRSRGGGTGQQRVAAEAEPWRQLRAKSAQNQLILRNQPGPGEDNPTDVQPEEPAAAATGSLMASAQGSPEPGFQASPTSGSTADSAGAITGTAVIPVQGPSDPKNQMGPATDIPTTGAPREPAAAMAMVPGTGIQGPFDPGNRMGPGTDTPAADIPRGEPARRGPASGLHRLALDEESQHQRTAESLRARRCELRRDRLRVARHQQRMLVVLGLAAAREAMVTRGTIAAPGRPEQGPGGRDGGRPGRETGWPRNQDQGGGGAGAQAQGAAGPKGVARGAEVHDGPDCRAVSTATGMAGASGDKAKQASEACHHGHAQTRDDRNCCQGRERGGESQADGGEQEEYGAARAAQKEGEAADQAKLSRRSAPPAGAAHQQQWERAAGEGTSDPGPSQGRTGATEASRPKRYRKTKQTEAPKLTEQEAEEAEQELMASNQERLAEMRAAVTRALGDEFPPPRDYWDRLSAEAEEQPLQQPKGVHEGDGEDSEEVTKLQSRIFTNSQSHIVINSQRHNILILQSNKVT